MRDWPRRWRLLPAVPARPVKKRLLPLAALLLLAIELAALVALDLPVVSVLAAFLLVAIPTLVLFWLVWRGLTGILWKVGRRLAFSYLLLGVLPIPMLAVLLVVATHLLSGFFLGHLYRDAVREVHEKIEDEAERRAELLARKGAADEPPTGEIAFAEYRMGRRVAGDRRAPETWPAWVEADGAADRSWWRREAPRTLFLLEDGTPTLAAAAGTTEAGVVAFWGSALDEAVAKRCGILARVRMPEEERQGAPRSLRVGSFEAPVQLLPRRHDPDPRARAFFAGRAENGDLLDLPLLGWGEVAGPLMRLDDGARLTESTTVVLSSSPRLAFRHLFSPSAEVDAYAWVGLLSLAGLLFWLYVAAALMAVFLIVGISRAVNRLSHATAQVQRGDFSVRIPVRRKDQVGALQENFNQMAANLERAVAAATEKEVLDKELAVARELQLSLLPRELPTTGGLELATLFEPSAAIGGDYFDVLRMDDGRLAVVVADVSGHGLSSGLHMAMLKAALGVLVETGVEPERILDRLDAMVRQGQDRRFFVTATLSLLDTETGELLLLNAGHPPTYRLRGAGVEEVLLPGAPLGGLGRRHGKARLTLEEGDVVVWLSDGLVEAADAGGEPFGYERVLAALAGEATSAAEVRDRLLAAVARHTGGEPPQDDQTMVVLRYGS